MELDTAKSKVVELKMTLQTIKEAMASEHMKKSNRPSKTMKRRWIGKSRHRRNIYRQNLANQPYSPKRPM
jgi:hypothetical protein